MKCPLCKTAMYVGLGVAQVPSCDNDKCTACPRYVAPDPKLWIQIDGGKLYSDDGVLDGWGHFSPNHFWTVDYWIHISMAAVFDSPSGFEYVYKLSTSLTYSTHPPADGVAATLEEAKAKALAGPPVKLVVQGLSYNFPGYSFPVLYGCQVCGAMGSSPGHNPGCPTVGTP